MSVTGGGPTEDEPDVRFAPPEDPGNVRHAMTIRVPDCQAASDVLRQRGAQFLTPPKDWSGECAASSATPTATFSESARPNSWYGTDQEIVRLRRGMRTFAKSNHTFPRTRKLRGTAKRT